MTVFRVGQRVRIKWSMGWPELAGGTGTIVQRAPHGGRTGLSEWSVAPDVWGTHVAPRPGRLGGTYFAPNSSQLEPLTDSYDLVSWESMRELWTPERLGTAA